MKNLFTLICLLALNIANAQYFQQRFNLNYAAPWLRNERCNSGIRTRVNLGGGGNPAQYYFAGIGTSYNNVALPAPHNVADRMRFERLNNVGAVLNNLGYQFADAGNIWFHASGNSIAEIKNANYNGGYVAVGAVTNNTITGANTIPGNSDALFVQLNAAGAVVTSRRIDINGGNDIAWCIRRSVVLVNNQPTWIVCGESRHGKDYTDCFVARVFSNGNIVWLNRYNFDPTGGAFNSARCIAKQLCEDPAGNIYAVGTLQDVPAGGNGVDGLAFKLTAGGAVIWTANYQAGNDDEFQAVRYTLDNNLIVGGFTNFGAVAPATSDMLIVKLSSANGAVIFQNILEANTGNTRYTSKCYDIIETAGPQYFLAGAATNGNTILEMMYKTNAAGLGINWYTYNRMLYNVGFGLDDVNVGNFPGVAYFASLKNFESTAFSDSHIMKTDYQGRSCNACTQYPPSNIPVNLKMSNRQWLQQPAGIWHLLIPAIFNYSNILICNQNDIHCDGIAADNTQSATANTLHDASVQLSPNPVVNTLHIQLSGLPQGEYQISLMNMDGKMVLQRNSAFNSGKSYADVDMSSLASGIYLVTIKHGALVLQQKVVKQ